ncbi:MAG: Hpt domain-containing protein [Treponema sp.]|nr:Hpt domain-containing protein [Treponema sp.]
MPDVIYIDEEEGRKRLMDNDKLYAKILAKFRDDTSLNSLVASAAAQDWEKALAAAHAVKGVAANLSLIELARQSLDVETQIKERALRPDSLDNLKACYGATMVEVERVIAKHA